MRYSFKVFVVSVLLLCLVPFFIPLSNAQSELEVPMDLVEAEETLVLAYNSVLDAEKAGANVSDLISQLNTGAQYLNQAHSNVDTGDFEAVVYFSNLCIEAIDGVSEQAILLMDEAVQLQSANLLIQIFGSIIGIAVVIMGGVLFWKIFKRYYLDRISELKPEVSNSEP